MPDTRLAMNLVHPARPGPRPMTAEDLWALPRVGPPVPSPDGGVVVVPVTRYDLESNEGRTRLWLVPAGGGEPRALTGAGRTSAEPAFSPDGRRLAFVRRTREGEGRHAGQAQLHVLPLAGGEAERLTDLPLGVFDPRWLPDGSGLVFAARVLRGHLTPEATAAELERRARDPVQAHLTEDRFYRHWDAWLTTGEVVHLFTLDLASRALRDLTPDSELWFEWLEPSGHYDLAPDGKELVCAAIRNDAARREPRSALYAVPFAGGPLACLTPEHPANDLRPRYTPDGRAIVYGAQHDPYFYADRVQLVRLDRATGAHTPLAPDWPLSPHAWSLAGDGTLLIEAECEARLDLFALRPGEREPRRLVRGGGVTGARWARDGRVHFTLQSLSAPPEAHACDLAGGTPRRLTHFTDEVLSRVALGEVREAWIEGAGGERVQMFVVLPPDWREGERRALVHVLHGGPHGISADGFHWRWNGQLFAAPGHVVAMVNFQGSTSWGNAFARRIQGGWPDRPFEDVMRATDALVAGGLADPARMAAAGGSYGGYLAAWIEGHSDRFRCLVNHAGVYDTLAQYASDWTLGRQQAFGGEPWEGIEAIHRVNPAHAAAGFTTPMLVIHGERDYRVPVSQGLECYGVLQAKGVPSRLVYFPDENHWILKPRNSVLWYQEVHAWLERWLRA